MPGHPGDTEKDRVIKPVRDQGGFTQPVREVGHHPELPGYGSEKPFRFTLPTIPSIVVTDANLGTVAPSASLPMWSAPESYIPTFLKQQMVTAPPSTKEMLSDLAGRLEGAQRERDRIEAEIQMILDTLQNLQRLYGEHGDTPPRPYGPREFRGMGVLDAIAKFFELTKDSALVSEVAKGLVSGGYETKSTDFTNTVYMTLRRDSESDDPVVRKYGKKWGLKRWENERGTKFAP
jgi:hypothetical protein